jgi:hypothetical protein
MYNCQIVALWGGVGGLFIGMALSLAIHVMMGLFNGSKKRSEQNKRKEVIKMLRSAIPTSISTYNV